MQLLYNHTMAPSHPNPLNKAVCSPTYLFVVGFGHESLQHHDVGGDVAVTGLVVCACACLVELGVGGDELGGSQTPCNMEMPDPPSFPRLRESSPPQLHH